MIHTIKCRKTGKVLAVSIGGGQCVCPDGQCSEESYQNPNAAQAVDFFTAGDKPAPLHPPVGCFSTVIDANLWVKPVQSIDYPDQMLRDRDTIARLRKALREITNLPEVEGDQAHQIARAALDWEVRS